MDRKMEILLSFMHLLENKVVISSDTIRHVRLILSIFNEDIFSEDDYREEIENLFNDGYLSKSKSGEIVVTSIGIALVKSIGKQTIGDTNYERLLHSISDYSVSKTKPDYIKNLGERLKNLHQAKANKVKSIDPNFIHALGILIKIQHKEDSLFTSEFHLIGEHLRDDEACNREKNILQNRLFHQYGSPFVVNCTGELLRIVGLVELDTVSIFNSTLVCSKKYSIDRKDESRWNAVIIEKFLEKALRIIGYRRSGQLTYTNYQSFESPPESQLREFASIKIEIITLKEDSLFVCIEPYKSTISSLLDFIKKCLQTGDTQTVILDKIKRLKLRVIPFSQAINFKEITWDKDLKHEKIPDSSHSLYEYWEHTHGISLTQPVQPVIIIQSNKKMLSYPSEMVFIDKNSLKNAYGIIPKRKPKYENLDERYNKIEFLFINFKSYRDENFDKYFVLNFIENSPNLNTLTNLNGFKETIQISPPLLEFFRGSISIDPLDVFNSEFGPFCGKKNLVISHLLTSIAISDRQIDRFCDIMQRIFIKLNLGTLKKSADIRVKKYDSNSNTHALESKIREFEKKTNPNGIGIAVIPDDNDSYYYSIKKLFPVKTGTPLQIIKQTSFDKLISSTFSGPKLLAMNIFIKSLKTNEAVWTLANAAGLSTENTLFVGIGFSQYPQEGKISKCATIMHDSHGAKITWKVFATPQQGRTIDVIWFETLLNRTHDIVDSEKPTRIVFYRTGSFYQKEMTAIHTAIKRCQWLSLIKVSFVSILDAPNCRFFKRNDKKCNLPAGYGLIINDKEAFLSTSNYDNRELRQGTVIPVRIKLELGDDTITDILKEYHDLTYLNWQAPITTAKHPLIVTIADRFAELTREGVPAENMFYLDL
ncbi:MAG: Piwi domain-containing protein [Methanoregulaceae archaeon]|jgi:hypothetical protein